MSAALPWTMFCAQAHASPADTESNIDPNANYAVFLQAIASDGIVMGNREAITEGFAVCKLIAPPDGGSLWDAAQQVMAGHSDLGIDRAMHFADRAIQDLCPNRGSF